MLDKSIRVFEWEKNVDQCIRFVISPNIGTSIDLKNSISVVLSLTILQSLAVLSCVLAWLFLYAASVHSLHLLPPFLYCVTNN